MKTDGTKNRKKGRKVHSEQNVTAQRRPARPKSASSYTRPETTSYGLKDEREVKTGKRSASNKNSSGKKPPSRLSGSTPRSLTGNSHFASENGKTYGTGRGHGAELGSQSAAKQQYYKFFSDGYIDLPFFAAVMALLVIGLIVLFSASFAYAYYYKGNSTEYIDKQLLFAVIGVVVMLVVSKIDYHYFRIIALPLLVVSILMLVVVLFLPAYDGQFHRWIYIGPFNFQPSEIVKFAVILYFSHLIARHADKMKTFKYGILPYGIILVVIAVLMLRQPHLSGTILVMGIGLSLIIIGGCNLKWFGGAAALGSVAALVYLFAFNGISYVETRLQAWLDKDFEPLGSRWQINQSLYAIGSGGLLGSGIGNSKQKYLYVSEPQNDFIFSIAGEELGFVGCLLIILLFIYLIWRAYKIAMRAPDRFGSLLVMGIAIQVGLQAALNIAVVTDSIPNTGISLPFFSYGGTALLILLFEMGVVLSVSKRSKVRKT